MKRGNELDKVARWMIDEKQAKNLQDFCGKNLIYLSAFKFLKMYYIVQFLNVIHWHSPWKIAPAILARLVYGVQSKWVISTPINPRAIFKLFEQRSQIRLPPTWVSTYRACQTNGQTNPPDKMSRKNTNNSRKLT